MAQQDKRRNYDFDTHTHLNVSAFEGEEKRSSRGKGTSRTRFAVVGFDTDTITRSLELSEEFKEVVSIIGWHPTEAYQYNNEQKSVSTGTPTHPSSGSFDGEMGRITIGKIRHELVKCSSPNHDLPKMAAGAGSQRR